MADGAVGGWRQGRLPSADALCFPCARMPAEDTWLRCTLRQPQLCCKVSIRRSKKGALHWRTCNPLGLALKHPWLQVWLETLSRRRTHEDDKHQVVQAEATCVLKPRQRGTAAFELDEMSVSTDSHCPSPGSSLCTSSVSPVDVTWQSHVQLRSCSDQEQVHVTEREEKNTKHSIDASSSDGHVLPVP